MSGPTPAAPPTTADQPPIVEQIYKAIDNIFGHKQDQLFTMEFPGRILEQGTYAYKGSDGIDAQEIKPEAVSEAEFRLSDDMYPVGRLTAGPNGEKLSEVYTNILDTLVPNGATSSNYEAQILPDQDRISEWLLEEVPNWIPPKSDALAQILGDKAGSNLPVKQGNSLSVGADDGAPPKTIPRVDLYQKLLDAYEDESFRWKQWTINARPKDDSDEKAWDEYNRTLAVFGPVVDAKLDALWTTLLVRGQYHRVRHFIGLIDISSASEELLAAKESLRLSVNRSVDNSQDIYPVQFAPANWAKYLSTDYTPQDLLMSPSAIADKIMMMDKERRQLVSQMEIYKSQVLTSDQLDALKTKVDTARARYTKAQNDMTAGFTSAAFTLVKWYLDSKRGQQAKAGELQGLLEQKGFADKISDAQIDQLVDMQKQCIQAQSDLETAGTDYAQAQQALTGAKASDTTPVMQQLKSQIDDLSANIADLQDLMQKVPANATTWAADGTPTDANADAGTTGPRPPSKGGAEEWTTVTSHGHIHQSAKTSSQSSSASASSFSVSFFFGSYGSSSSSSSASSAMSDKEFDLEIDVAFSAMKVTMTRPWFDASILHSTQGYFRVGNGRISPGTQWLKDLEDDHVDPKTKDAELDKANQCLLPTFPIAFLVAKDVSIAITVTSSDTSVTGKEVAEAASSGGGFLCFSCSSSHSSSSSEHAAYTSVSGNKVTIRMPGPQVLGWFLQAVALDETSTTYTPLAKDIFVSAKNTTKPT